METENLSEFEIKVEKIKKLEALGEKAYKAKFNKTHEIHDLEKYELGTKVSIEHQSSNEIRGKRSVATQLEETLNTFFEGKGELSVRTPLELE